LQQVIPALLEKEEKIVAFASNHTTPLNIGRHLNFINVLFPLKINLESKKL